MIIERKPIENEENFLLESQEDHFFDIKSSEIQPKKLQESFVSFANSDGGDLWIGIEDKKRDGERIKGFTSIEGANDIITILLEETKPAVENLETEFVDFGNRGFVLHFSIPKSPKVHYCSNGDCYIRINANKRKIVGERVTQLGYAKGSIPYEKQIVDIAEVGDFIDNCNLKDYLKRINSKMEPKLFLRKQRLLSKKGEEYIPNVGCVLMFDDEPQATLDTRCALKVYRLLTSGNDYKREQLSELPRTINGTVEQQIQNGVKAVTDLLSDVSYNVGGKVEKLRYPSEAIHEILVNAIIHRDYSLNDDIHIKIYDNRIEIQSPGRLPGYITPENIYEERFSRNPNIVRLLHNLPNPVNHDIGEGLNTARNEMRKAGLVAPEIKELDNAVVVVIKHQKLASLEDIILDYLNDNMFITNKIVRELSGEEDVNKVKKAFQKLRKQGLIEPEKENVRAFDYRYILKKQIH
ncbi:ATP-binding protein [Methanosarcina sp. Mfa9]|uniref:ATP-binding protein n=1 Tax=Methanosarcina sp. Mfa9 TaxID=3439063 RepID=UPI003F83C52F